MGHRDKTERHHNRHGTGIGTAATMAILSAQTAAAADTGTAAQPYHAALTDHVPVFITAPGQTDYLFVTVIVLMLLMILAIGNFYFQLHAVPERIAHRANKVQLEIVAVLALISLFTHNHIYWIIGLLLAMVRIPDFSTPLYSIARSIARLASRSPEAGIAQGTPVPPAEALPVEEPSAAAAPRHEANHGSTGAPVSGAPVSGAPVSGAPIAPAPSPQPQLVQPVVKASAQEKGI
ncbi:hypothetical protein FHX15_001707 [Rhizobium sp. BK650]|uniref:hypothetical protein n=1 Tax=Rhizobium sp. BK650 TaxID=2586990 RepID=UPI001794D8C3|nr:hypothetical protein [Rhizobium sp. BK650]